MKKLSPQNIQLVFYFGSDIRPKLFSICNELLNKAREAQLIMFPVNQGVLPVADAPLALVPIDDHEQLQISMSFISFNTSSFNKIIAIGKKVINVLGKNNIQIVRVGMVPNFAFPSEKIIPLKQKLFEKDSMPELDFQYARFYSLTSDFAPNINLWKRYYTNYEMSEDLFSEIDVNTPIQKNAIIDVSYFDKFVLFAQKTILKYLEEDDVL